MAPTWRIICVMCWFIQKWGVSICTCASVFVLWAVWHNNGLQRGRPSAGCTRTDDEASPSQVRQAAKYEVTIPIFIGLFNLDYRFGNPCLISCHKWMETSLWNIAVNPNQHSKRCQSHRELKHLNGLHRDGFTARTDNLWCVQVTQETWTTDNTRYINTMTSQQEQTRN